MYMCVYVYDEFCHGPDITILIIHGLRVIHELFTMDNDNRHLFQRCTIAREGGHDPQTPNLSALGSYPWEPKNS